MMISLKQTFDETRAVKVLVVPLGSNRLFDKHFEIVSNLKEIPFYELNRPYNTSNTAFKYFNWKDGNILFDFHRYDRTALIGPGDLNDFQSSSRILMIMGLINYPEIGETKETIEEELEYFARKHQHVILKRMFVFNYAFDDPITTSLLSSSSLTPPPKRPLKSYINDPNSLIIFPPEGICEGGVSMIEVHLKEVMSHASLHILLALDQQMKNCEEARMNNHLPAQLSLSTLFDEMEEQQQLQQKQTSGNTISMAISVRNTNKRMYKKKPSGRIHKWMGDLSMQACSPRDAIEHYMQSIVECRALNETLWLAGALDGYANAVLSLIHMTQIMQQPPFTLDEVLGKDLYAINLTHASSIDDVQQQSVLTDNNLLMEKAFRLAEDRMNEAIAIYSNNIIYCTLEVECIMRAAKVQELIPSSNGKEIKAMSYVMKAITVPGLNCQQQIECILEAGLLCYRLGLKRKYALFLFLAAILNIENQNYAVAQALLNSTCSICGITSSIANSSDCLENDCTNSLGISSTKDKSIVIDKNPLNLSNLSGWTKLKLTLLSSCVLVADEQDDILVATKHVTALFRLIQNTEEIHYTDRNKWLLYSLNNFFRTEQQLNSTSSIDNSNYSHRNLFKADIHEYEHQGLAASKSSFSIESCSGGFGHHEYRSGDGIIGASSSPLLNKRISNKYDNSSSVINPPPPVDNTRRKDSISSAVSNYCSSPSTNHLLHKPLRPNSFMDGVSNNGETSGLFAELTSSLALSSQPSNTESFTRQCLIPKLPGILDALAFAAIKDAAPSKENYIFDINQNSILLDVIKSLISSKDLESITLQQVATELQHYHQREINTNIMNSNIDPVVALTLEYLNKILSSQMYPLDFQEEVFGVFARLSKLVIPQSCFLDLPITLISLNAMELIGYKKPIVMSSSILDIVRSNSAKYKQYLLTDSSFPLGIPQQQQQPDNALAVVASEPTENTTSRLFYDPFAAKRKKKESEESKKKGSMLFWVVGELCKVKAIFRNYLSIPLFLDNISLVFTGSKHEVHSMPIQIPPNTDCFEVTLSVIPLEVGTLKLVGVQIVCNNVTSTLESAHIATTNADLYRDDSIAVMPSSPALQIVTESSELFDANSPTIAHSTTGVTDLLSDYADVSMHLDLYPGEERNEKVFLKSIPSSRIFGGNAFNNEEKVISAGSDDIEANDMLENDYQVFIQPHNNILTSENCRQHIATEVLGYSNTFAATDDNHQKNASSLTTYCCTLIAYNNLTNIQRKDFRSKIPLNLSCLKFKFIEDLTLHSVDIVIEIVSIHKKISNFVKDFLKYDETNPVASELADATCSKYSLGDLDHCIDALNMIYSRQIRLRVFIHHLPGLQLMKYVHILPHTVHSSLSSQHATTNTTTELSGINLPIPDHEAKRLSQSLCKLLDINQQYDNNNNSISSRSSKIKIDLITSSIKILFEIKNASNQIVYVGSNEMQLHVLNETTTTTTIAAATKHNMLLINSNILATCKEPLFIIAPKSTQCLIIEYPQPFNSKDEYGGIQNLYLIWGIRNGHRCNTYRVGKIPFISNNNYDFINISPKTIFQKQLVIKPLVIMKTLLYKQLNGIQDLLLPIFNRNCDDQLNNNLYHVKVGKFVTISIEISRLFMKEISLGDDLMTNKSSILDYSELDLIIVIIDNESPIIEDFNSLDRTITADIASNEFSSNNSSKNDKSDNSCIMIGKRYAKYFVPNHRLVGSVNENNLLIIKHKLQLCFSKEGSYSVYPLLKMMEKRGDAVVQEEDSSCWWTSSDAYIRIISSSS